jgi:hypothetical protein
VKKPRVGVIIFGLLCLTAGVAAAIFVGMKRGIPFVTEREQWTIGIYRGNSPFSFTNPLNWINPILRAEDVTDVPAKFVADPFLVKEEKSWNLFFEVYNLDTKQGDLALASSTNTWFWDYQQVILDEPFHLSYPYVFEWENEHYLIPESFEDNSVRLYKADEYPLKWSFVTRLVEGKDYVDNSIVYFNNNWWLFSATTNNEDLYLFYADNLEGPWTEHPLSPIVKGNKHIARPSGRLLVYDGHLYRYTMDIDPPVGTHQVMAIEITEISPTSYAEKLVSSVPVLQASGRGWNEQAMHQLDPIQLSENEWIASVDGFGNYLLFGWDH